MGTPRQKPSRARVLIEEWKKKLIDLSRRNRLLYFKRSKRGTLRILDPDLETVFTALVSDEKAWHFYIPPEEPEGELDFDDNSQSQVELEDSSETGKDDAVIDPDREPDELVTDGKEGKSITATLRNLERRARNDFEERGTRILYVVFGVLRWNDTDTSEVSSPLLLLPVELTRESINDPFTLGPLDEDIVFNPALKAKFATDFRTDFPDLPEDWEETTVGDYFDKIERKVQKYGFSVDRQCWIGLFSFHKFVIYQDLTAHVDSVSEHPIIGLLSGDEQNAPTPLSVSAEELDSSLPPTESYLVTDADSSQLACIELVKKGANLVIQGPPGTGKSQTITNLIAEYIARGKKVLFVSEKMAALRVVSSRLDRAKLNHFCLELHSHRVNKREVVQELYKTYLQTLKPNGAMTSQEFARLVQRRDHLNAYVRALHRIRAPMQQSVFQVLGRLATLDSFVLVAAKVPNIAGLTPEIVDEFEQLSFKLKHVWSVPCRGQEFPWYGLKQIQYSLSFKNEVEQAITLALRKLQSLDNFCGDLSSHFGLPSITTISESKHLVEIAKLVESCPGIERSWLSESYLESLLPKLSGVQDLANKWTNQRGIIEARYSQGIYLLPPDIEEKIRGCSKAIEDLLGESVQKSASFVEQRHTFAKTCQHLNVRFRDWTRDAESLTSELGLDTPSTLAGVRTLLDVIPLCDVPYRPDKSWFTPGKISDIKRQLPTWKAAYTARNKNRRRILELYYEDIFDLDLEELDTKFSTEYSSVFRFLKPSYYQTKKKLARIARTASLTPDFVSDVRLAREVKRQESALRNQFPVVSEMLGSWFNEFDTDFEGVPKAVECTEQFFSILGNTSVSEKFVQLASNKGSLSATVRAVSQRLHREIREDQDSLQVVENMLRSGRLPQTGCGLEESSLSLVTTWFEAVTGAMLAFEGICDQVIGESKAPKDYSICTILVDLENVRQVRRMEQLLKEQETELKSAFGSRFDGFSTNFNEVTRALLWTKQFVSTMGNKQVPKELTALVVEPKPLSHSSSELAESIKQTKSASGAVTGLFSTSWAADIDRDDCVLSTAYDHFLNLQSQTDLIRDWCDYKQTELEFQRLDGAGLLRSLQECEPQLTSEHLENVVRKAILFSWVEEAFKSDEPLGRFRGELHEQLITEFCELDRMQWELGSHRVIRSANSFKPSLESTVPGSEHQILLREANKQRRHLALRKLFSLIPGLLVQLKPCLLMSPITVSQFLDPDRVKFDLVIFDEASQVRSEDSACSIYRGQQVVLCGDNKQLPPTAFFEQAMADDSIEESESAAEFDVFDSILDECSTRFPQRRLLWHYRSEHESLIAFSNHLFYDKSLVTFPSWLKKDDNLGVKFVYVPNAIYDRGGRRDNQIEAERVVGLVDEHIRSGRDQSLGVVAFSVAQAECIDNSIEEFRKDNPELEYFFDKSRGENFFVRNLESVQGDERDVLIFSIGYGRDRFGKLTMHFGPVNLPGGERRLNVAVTRARKKVLVVSSIRASELDMADVTAPGVRALHRYLDYAERGPDSLMLETGSGDFESPLEREVASAVRGFGFEVVPQVGCSGYRVDLGVIDPAFPGRYLIGIECDGAMYHSAATARDRDRLRQQILEKLGWKIHRVWSPDWISRRSLEVTRLRSAIEAARSRTSYLSTESKGPTPALSDRAKITAVNVVQHPPPENEWSLPKWVVVYRTSKPHYRSSGGVVSRETLTDMVLEVVSKEAPVSKDLVARRISRAIGWERTGARLTRALDAIYASLKSRKEISTAKEFVFTTDSDSELVVRHPDPNDSESRRTINQISDEEIGLAIRRLVADGISIPPEALLTATARIFGFDRLGNHIQKRLEKVLTQLVKSGTLVQTDDRITANINGHSGNDS